MPALFSTAPLISHLSVSAGLLQLSSQKPHCAYWKKQDSGYPRDPGHLLPCRTHSGTRQETSLTVWRGDRQSGRPGGITRGGRAGSSAEPGAGTVLRPELAAAGSVNKGSCQGTVVHER